MPELTGKLGRLLALVVDERHPLIRTLFVVLFRMGMLPEMKTRFRDVRMGSDGALYVLTDSGGTATRVR